MKYEIAIPSYKRYADVMHKTLRYLVQAEIPFRRITVFVANEKEYKIYKSVMHSEVDLVVGVPTLCAQRKFIRNYYDNGTYMVSIDDDIEGIYTAPTSHRKDLRLVLDLENFISEAFSVCRRFGSTLWGVNPVLNPFFMSGKGVSSDLRYIGGGFYGEIINHDRKLDVTLEDKEDFERSILHYIHTGNVIRFNEYSFKTRAYGGAGGMQETRTEKRITDSAMYLANKYPQYCKINTGKKNKTHTEVKLIRQ